MNASTIKWHLARDNQLKLARFCGENKTKQNASKVYPCYDGNYFVMLYEFDNDGFIKAELRAGDTKSYSVSDHFQVIDYSLGK